MCTQIKDALGNSEFFEYTETFEIYREIDPAIYDMAPRSILVANRFFAGPVQHLSGNAPELVVNSIPTVDNTNVTTILNVIVK